MKKSRNISKLIVGIMFHLKLAVLTVSTKFDQKRHFRSKTKKVNSIIARIRPATKFQLQVIILFFGLNLPKESISGQKRKNCIIECGIFESV